MCIKGLRVENLTVCYREKDKENKVISGLSFALEQGKTLAVLGASGCGKSTLISVLAGEIKPVAGEIVRASRVALIAQGGGLLPWKTLNENCRLPFAIRKEKLTAAKQKEIDDIYELLGINMLLDKYPSFLSGGECRRGAIAQAFIQNPELLLMDEPFSALDAINREKAWEQFFRIWELYKPTTVLVTHSIDEALYLGNIVAVMGSSQGMGEGSQMLYMRENTYFAKFEPIDTAYVKLKNNLREMLK